MTDDRIGWSIRLLLGTGMRTQELLAPEPEHIEPDGSCIHIRQEAIARFSGAFGAKPTPPKAPDDKACKVLDFPFAGSA